MNEPLKNKDCLYILPDSNDLHDSLKTAHVYKKKSVKSAVEWLKEEIEKYPNIQLTHMKLNALIDEAFPDLCPLGDLIADKQNPQDIDKELKKLVHEFALRA